MNNTRRKELQLVIAQMDALCASLEALLAEEEEYRDNILENMQSGENYQKADAACDNLEDAISSLEDAISCAEDALE